MTMSLRETVIYYGLKGCFYVRVSLCSFHESNIFGERVVFRMDAYHIFSQCVLAVIPLKGGMIFVVVMRVYTGC